LGHSTHNRKGCFSRPANSCEPSVGITHRLKYEIFDAIRQIRDCGVAFLMAEQEALSALRIADRAVDSAQ
jgi:ABC-type sugar transport system ATPase subunit